MEITDQDINEGLRAAINEMTVYIGDQRESLVILRETAKSFFMSASFVITLVMSLNIIYVKVNPSWSTPYRILLTLLILSYCGFTYYSLKSFIPSPIIKPFPDDYEDLTVSLCTQETERQAMILSAYLKSIEYNRPIIIRKSSHVKWAALLWGVMIVLVILIAAIPKI